MPTAPTATHPLIFAYDLGKESIGYCVREAIDFSEDTPEEAFVHSVKAIGVHLVDPNHASIKDRGLATRRRQIRTRFAHKMRETWFRWFWCEQLGLEALPMEAPEWTFSGVQQGKYWNPIALRIALLQGLANPDGTPLSQQQCFRALHHAIQRRGYDKVAWEKGEDTEGTQLTQAYDKLLKEANLPEGYPHPAYFEGFMLGVWHPETPNQLHNQLTQQAKKVRHEKTSAPRKVVEAELRALFTALQTLFSDNNPLQSVRVKQFLFGSSEYMSASFGGKADQAPGDIRRRLIEKYAKFRGSNRTVSCRIGGKYFPQYLHTKPSPSNFQPYLQGEAPVAFPFDWEGVLSQKTARFDNRILAKCCLLPRFNVCRNTYDNDQTKAQEGTKWGIVNDVKALMMLKNLRYITHDNNNAMLTPDELNRVWQAFVGDSQNSLSATWLNKTLPLHTNAAKFAKNAVAKKMYKQFDDWKPSDSGRSRFCRPAAYLLRACLLEGKAPKAFVEDCIANGHYPAQYGQLLPLQPNTKEGQRKGLTEADLRDFAKHLGDSTWEVIHIADKRDHHLGLPLPERERLIEKLIGNCMNNVVRNRLQLFYHLFKQQLATHGQPEKVVLEFVRDQNVLGGNEQAKQIEKRMKENAKENQRRADEITAKNAPVNGKNIRKWALWEEQGKVCLYTGDPIPNPLDDRWDIEHVVPRSQGGSDDRSNLILADKVFNRQVKGDKAPYEYFKSQGVQAFAAYQGRVLKCKGLSKQKTKILTTANAHELIDSYNGLADTSYIARLVQQLVAIYCNKGLQVEGQARFILVAHGKQTAAMARELNAYLGLYDDPSKLTDADFDVKHHPITGELVSQSAKKNRANKRHHGVDAYLLSYHPELFSNTFVNTDEFKGWQQRFERNRITTALRSSCQSIVKRITPRMLKRNRIELDLEETFYGARFNEASNTYTIFKHRKLADLKANHVTKVVDPAIKALLEATPATQWKNLIHPRYGTPINKIMLVETTVKASDVVVNSNGRRVFGEYGELNMLGVVGKGKSKVGVQLKRPKQNPGQIIYFDKKGKPKVQVVYSYVGEAETRKNLATKGLKLFQDGLLLHSGMTIYWTKEIPQLVEKNLFANTCYEISSIKAKGALVVKGNTAEPSIAYFIEAGLQLYKG